MSTVVAERSAGVDRSVVGLSLAVFANLLFATSDAIVKLLTQRFSVFEVIVLQASFAMIPFGVMLYRDGGLARVHIRNPRFVFLRAFLAGTGTVFGFFAVSKLPLAETYSIQFCMPIIVSLLSIPLLGERVGPHRAAAIVFGFIGILVMVRPGFKELHIGHAAALTSALVGGFNTLLMRKISREEQPSVLVAAVIVGLIVVSLPGMIVTFRMPELRDVMLFACTGLIMGTAQYFILRALAQAPASVIAPMQYSMMIWAIIYGYVLFGNVVDPYVLAGAMIVIASSVYIMHRERRAAEALLAAR